MLWSIASLSCAKQASVDERQSKGQQSKAKVGLGWDRLVAHRDAKYDGNRRNQQGDKQQVARTR